MRFLACICPFKRENDGCGKSYEKFLLSAQKEIFALFLLKIRSAEKNSADLYVCPKECARLFCERIALCVFLNLANEKHDAFDQAPDTGNGRACKAGENGDEKLSDSLTGEAEIEVVYAKATKENAEKTGNELGFCAGGSRFGLCSSGLFKRSAALYADHSFGIVFETAVRAEFLAFACRNTAFYAYGSFCCHFVSAITTKYEYILQK